MNNLIYQEIVKEDEWIRELYRFLAKAKEENKLVRHKYYQYLIFTPDDLVEQILNGHFRWGVPNWELIDSKVNLNNIITRA